MVFFLIYLLWKFLLSTDMRHNFHYFFDGDHSTHHAAMETNNLDAIYLTLHIHQVINNMLMLGGVEVTGPRLKEVLPFLFQVDSC